MTNSATIYRYYWNIETKTHQIWLHADKFEIIEGNAIFMREDGTILYSISTGNWITAYAASCIDGRAVCIEHIDMVQRKK